MANPSPDYPTAIHTDTDISGFGSTALGSTTPTHTAVEGKQEEELKAVQTKIGTGSSTPTAGKLLQGSGTGTSAWATVTQDDVGDGTTNKQYSATDKSKVGTAEITTNKATDFTTVNNTLYPTVQAVNNAIGTAVTGLLDYRGSYDAHLNTFPATGGSGTAGAILKGDFWMCSVAGTLGGTAVTAGDLIIALQDTPAQTAGNWDLVSHDVNYVPEDVANKKTALTDNSDTYYPSQKAVKTAVDGKLDLHAASDSTTGNAATATKLATARAINGVNFDGSAPITILPRTSSATSYTTDTGTSINCDTQDMFIVTAQAGALKFNNPSGTPNEGQKLIITVASSTTAARNLTWDTGYGPTTIALPTTTAATTVTLSMGFIYSISKSLWQIVAVA